jgi:predicted nucleic acid-binding protein
MLFDSCVLIDALNGHELAQALIDTDVEQKISVVTRTEVVAGVKIDLMLSRTLRLLDMFDNHDVSRTIADHAGHLRMAHNLKTPDAMIAATAIMFNQTLVTRDKGFSNIIGLDVKFYPY